MRTSLRGVATAAATIALTSLIAIPLANSVGADPGPTRVSVPITSPTTVTTTSTTTTTTTIPAAPLCPAAAGNARFVRFIYMKILQRCPDSGAATYWTSRLDAGMGRWAFAEAIDMSEENVVKNNVVPIFNEALKRAPTAGELAQWSSYIRTNHADAAFIAALLSSNEAYAMLVGDHLAKDQAWLNLAYNTILDRNPDAPGGAHFTAMLGAGGSTQATRLAVALHLEYSAENAGGWVGAVYGAAFGRGPDAGIGYWMGWLMGSGQWQTFRMWTHFLASNEGYALAQTQPNPPPEEH